MKESLAGLILFLFFITDSDAQYLGLRAGMNLSSMFQKDYTKTYSTDFDLVPGFQAGPVADFAVTRSVYLETSLILTVKGYSFKHTETAQGQITEFREKLELYYLEIPATAKIYLPPGTSSFYVAAGPYIGIGLLGTHYTAQDEEDYLARKIKWGSDPAADDFTRTDFGLSASTGIDLNRFQICLGYELSLVNISPYSDYGFKELNRVFSIMLGYKILKRESGKSKNTAF